MLSKKFDSYKNYFKIYNSYNLVTIFPTSFIGKAWLDDAYTLGELKGLTQAPKESDC